MKKMISILLTGILTLGTGTVAVANNAAGDKAAQNVNTGVMQVSEAVPETMTVNVKKIADASEAKANSYVCEVGGCTQTTEHSHAVCGIENCPEAGTHAHEGIYYLAHHDGDGHSYHTPAFTCDIAGCTQTTEHSHDVCPDGSCSNTDSHDHDGAWYYGHYEGDSHDHSGSNSGQQAPQEPTQPTPEPEQPEPEPEPAVFSCGYDWCTVEGEHAHGACGVDGCNQAGDHSHSLCGVDGCEIGYTHDHDGTLYYGHHAEDGHGHGGGGGSYCGVEGCNQTGDHSHDYSGGGHHGGHRGGHH